MLSDDARGILGSQTVGSDEHGKIALVTCESNTPDIPALAIVVSPRDVNRADPSNALNSRLNVSLRGIMRDDGTTVESEKSAQDVAVNDSGNITTGSAYGTEGSVGVTDKLRKVTIGIAEGDSQRASRTLLGRCGHDARNHGQLKELRAELISPVHAVRRVEIDTVLIGSAECDSTSLSCNGVVASEHSVVVGLESVALVRGVEPGSQVGRCPRSTANGVSRGSTRVEVELSRVPVSRCNTAVHGITVEVNTVRVTIV
mmetsp:Transcript_14282/g.26218  ORF Transcript_14282/g.26218 Transcript_14282/m.26218 type:complete len:258 (+) Transcript_14282:5296-6069(+)